MISYDIDYEKSKDVIVTYINVVIEKEDEHLMWIMSVENKKRFTLNKSKIAFMKERKYPVNLKR